MKKILALGLISFSLSASLAEAKFFLGIEGGYEMSDAVVPAGSKNHVIWGSSAFGRDLGMDGWTVGINLGTEHSLTDLFGLRWFLGLNYGENTNFKYAHRLQYFEIQLGVDAILNVVKSESASFGLFLGLGTNFNAGDFNGNFFKADLPQEDYQNYGQAGLFGRVGLTLGLGAHSRIDLTAHIPIMNVVLTDDGGAIYNPLRFTLGYKYLF